jgi:hypothetical protein
LIGSIREVPIKYMLVLPLTLIVIGYTFAIAFDFNLSPLKYDVHAGWMYGLGQVPIFLILAVLETWGYIDENEDRVLMRQRRERSQEIDEELATSRKPGWWSKRYADKYSSPDEQLKALTNEVGSGRATQPRPEYSMEMGDIPAQSQSSKADIGPDGDLRPTSDAAKSWAAARLSSTASSLTVTSQNPPARAQGMLDV